MPPRTLCLDADVTRISATRYQLYAPGRGCVELSGRSAGRLAGALRRLDGSVTLDGACCGLRPDEQQLFEDLLRRLQGLRMIHKQPYHPGPARIGVIGEGSCAEHIRHALVGTHHVQGFTESLPPVIEQQARGALMTRPAPRIDRLDHWTDVDTARLDLVVVAGSRPAPDPVLSWLLSRRGIPHLIVSAHHRYACVGPLVRPGTTSCAFCAAGPTAERGHLPVDDEAAAPLPVVLDWAVAITRSVSAAYLDEGTVCPTVEFSGGIWSHRAPRADCRLCAGSDQPSPAGVEAS